MRANSQKTAALEECFRQFFGRSIPLHDRQLELISIHFESFPGMESNQLILFAAHETDVPEVRQDCPQVLRAWDEPKLRNIRWEIAPDKLDLVFR